MLKGDSKLFSNIVCDNFKASFYAAYPIKNEMVELRLLYFMDKMVYPGLLNFIEYTGINANIKGRLNQAMFKSHIKRYMYDLLLSLTPNLPKLVNTRLSEFDKHFSRLMLPHIRRWRSKDVDTKSQPRRVRTKAIPKGSTTGDRESVVGS